MRARKEIKDLLKTKACQDRHTGRRAKSCIRHGPEQEDTRFETKRDMQSLRVVCRC